MWQTNWYHFFFLFIFFPLSRNKARNLPQGGRIVQSAENWTDLFGKTVRIESKTKTTKCYLMREGGEKLIPSVVPAVDARFPFPPFDWTNWHMWQRMCSQYSWEYVDQKRRMRRRRRRKFKLQCNAICQQCRKVVANLKTQSNLAKSKSSEGQHHQNVWHNKTHTHAHTHATCPPGSWQRVLCRKKTMAEHRRSENDNVKVLQLKSSKSNTL